MRTMVDPNSRSDPKLQELMKVRGNWKGVQVPPTPQVSLDQSPCVGRHHSSHCRENRNPQQSLAIGSLQSRRWTSTG